MTAPPQLGPLLGRIASGPRPQEPPGFPSLRLAFADLLFERAAVARDLAAAGDPEAARSALGKPAWLSAWREAAGMAADAILARGAEELRRAAAESRIPARPLSMLRPGPAEETRIRARCDAAGIPLEEALSAPVEGRGWEGWLRAAAGAAEVSWLALEAVAVEELGRQRAIAARVRVWRRSTRPLWLASGGAVVSALLLGLVIGGYLPAPSWLQPVVDWWWSLPWP